MAWEQSFAFVRESVTAQRQSEHITLMKPKRTIFRVMPVRVHPYGWTITEGLKRDIISTTFYLKTAAITYAVRVAKENMPSQVVIYKRNGQIQSERTYGQDPERSKG